MPAKTKSVKRTRTARPAKLHAQHKPADPIEPGCQGADCTDGTCSVCAAVPDDQWIAWKRVAHAPKVKRARTTGSSLLDALAAANLRNDAIRLVERLALYWVEEDTAGDEPGSAKEAFELLVRHGYTAVLVAPATLRRPDGSRVTR